MLVYLAIVFTHIQSCLCTWLLLFSQQLQIQGRFGFHDVQLVKSDENSLGVGSYEAVYRDKCDQLVCAAKVLHPILFHTRDPSAYRIVERFQREVEFLSGLKHPNIIQYLGSCVDPETRLPILFMELMDESLTRFLERPADPPPLPLHVQVDIGLDIVQALSHLHRHDILHRDLSSNNVLLIGSRRAKVTDFGMAKLLGSDPRLTPTYCPGTNAYMSPEALADPPAYTSKLDIFSSGVLFIQLITRKFPNLGPRMHVVQLNDPRFPSGRVHVDVPELERRKEYLDLISPTHPLLEVALDCLKDKEGQRPMAEQLCTRLIALKESAAYRDSFQKLQETLGQTLPARDQELEQQLRESESRVENLTREVQELRQQCKEEVRNTDQLVQQKNSVILQLQLRIQRKNEEIQKIIHANRREREQVAREKNEALRIREKLLQEKEMMVQKLQERLKGVEESDKGTGILNLEWMEGPSLPFPVFGSSVAVHGGMVDLCDGTSDTQVLMFNSETGQWIALAKCPKNYFSLAVVNGLLTAVGGKLKDKKTNTLLSLALVSSQKWTKQFPPMIYCHNSPAVTTTEMSLIVAGGWEGYTEKLKIVEVLDTQSLQWSTVESLPSPLFEATATICGDRLYLGGGSTSGGWNKSVFMCEVKDLQSQPDPHNSSHPVWKEVASLPVVQFSLVTFQGKLLAVGGGTASNTASAEVRQYDTATNSWSTISEMS